MTKKIIYPTVSVTLCKKDAQDDTTGLTIEGAKQLLGWTQPEPGQPPFKEYLLKDRVGVTTACTNNDNNRPFYYQSLCLPLMFAILAGKYRLNGESIIIGKTGEILDGQHRLIALVLAVQEWLANPDKYPYWTEAPTIDVLIVTGVDESLETINTINVGKSRSLGDAIYACKLFKGSAKQAKALSKVSDYAIRMLWSRTGACDNAFSVKRDHVESIAFLTRHPKLIEFVEYAHELNGPNKVFNNYLSTGYLAALAYLMAVDVKTGQAYHNADLPSESDIKFSHATKVKEYLSDIALMDARVAPLRKAFAKLFEQGGGTIAERVALIVSGWIAYKKEGKVADKYLALSYHEQDGIRTLVSCPVVGGIDLGPS